MQLLHTLFFTLVTLGVLVTFHEYGHFWVARRCGVRVLKFSIGFGKPLFSWKRGDTEYMVAAIPLGGYVKMFGENPDEDAEPLTEDEKQVSFSHKSVAQRMAIVAAGPIANFILAILLYWLVLLGGTQGLAPVIAEPEAGSPAAVAGLEAGDELVEIDGRPVQTWTEVHEALLPRIGETGAIAMTTRPWASGETPQVSRLEVVNWLADSEVPDVTGSLGLDAIRPPFPPLVDEVVPGSAAERAGFRSGDLIVSLDGVETVDWNWWRDQVRAAPGSVLQIGVLRDGDLLVLELIPETVEEEGRSIGRAGLAPVPPSWPEEMVRQIDHGIIEAATGAVQKTVDATLLIVGTLKKMLVGMISTSGIGGPITIAKVAGTTAEFGWQPFLGFLAILSVSLGVLNLLPIPVLDGGHLLFYSIEAVKGSPLGLRAQAVAYRVGLILLVGIMLLALYNDFSRL